MFERQSDLVFGKRRQRRLGIQQVVELCLLHPQGKAAVVSNAVGDEHFADLRQHYSEQDIVDILGIISYFGFLYRWNDSMATSLEPIPTSIGETHPSEGGWNPGKHK